MTTLPVNEVVGRIEGELNAFWSAPDTQTGSPMAKVRASTMSYVISVAHTGVALATEATDRIVETHPGRAFVLSIDGRLAPWEVAYEVRAACRIDGGTEPICYDWLDVQFGAMAAERALSVVSALALPEVPVVAEVGKGAPAALVAPMAQRADRLIVDSAHTSFTRIAEIAEAARCPVGDRQFVRTYSWRDLVARFFDDAMGALSAIREVTIERTPGGATEPAALLLGWLGSRLGWTFEARDRARSSTGEPIAIALREDGRGDVEPGQITAVRIETSLEGKALSLSCARGEAKGTLRWTREGALSSAHEHPLGYRDEAWVLVKAIDAIEGDKVYQQVLRAAAAWEQR